MTAYPLPVADPLNSTIRQRLGRVLRRVREAVRPRRVDPEQAAAAARVAAVGAYQRGRSGAQERGAPGEPPPQTQGVVTPIPGPALLHSKEAQAALGRRSTRYERYAARGGWGPVGWSTYQELTLDRIRQVHDQVDFQGVMLQKDDTDRRVLRRESHTHGNDRARRSKVYRAPLDLRPCNTSRPARIVCNFVRQVFDDYDGMLDGMHELTYANAAGVSVAEVVYKEPRPLLVVTGKDETATIEAEGIAQLAPILNRYLRFDVTDDRPWIEMQGSTVDPYRDPATNEPTYKVLVHATHGDGHARQRGYMFALHYLSAFKSLAWEKWITVLELYGSPNPYLQMAGAGFTSDEDKDDAYQALSEVGKGVPTVVHARWGELKAAPIPSGIDSRGVHGAIMGALNAEMSKAVQGETLTAEIGGVGSYKASEIHENQQENVQIMDCRRLEVTLRNLARFIVAVNAEALARVAGVSPEAVKELVPLVRFFLDRTVTPVERLGMFVTAKRDLGMSIDPAQIYEEFHFRQGDEPAVVEPDQQEGEGGADQGGGDA